jgi:hypothetical protein
MPTKKIVDDIDEILDGPVEESEAKKKFRKTIEDYKVQNPVKYAQKEEALLKKLNSL